MSLPDTIFIFVLALIIFGPKKLPEIGRQIGRLVGEFRRASNEFKFQIEEELRLAELNDKKVKEPTITPPREEVSSTAATDVMETLPAGQRPNLENFDISAVDAAEPVSDVLLEDVNQDGALARTVESELQVVAAEGAQPRTSLPFVHPDVDEIELQAETALTTANGKFDQPSLFSGAVSADARTLARGDDADLDTAVASADLTHG